MRFDRWSLICFWEISDAGNNFHELFGAMIRRHVISNYVGSIKDQRSNNKFTICRLKQVLVVELNASLAGSKLGYCLLALLGIPFVT